MVTITLPDGSQRPFEHPVTVGEVAASKSLPPQYFLSVRTAQPDGCHKDAGWDVKIDGTTVYVTVNNSGPADLSVVLCTMIYGETDHSVRLGTGEDFETGESVLVDTSSALVRANYQKQMRRLRERPIALFKKFGLDYCVVRTDRPYIGPLRDLFARRARRVHR